MKKYVIFKLSCGQEIIGKISTRKKNIDSYEIEEPLLILSSILDNGSTIILLRQYATLSSDKIVFIEKSHLICSFSPKPIFIEYYEVMLSYIAKHIEHDIESGMKTAISVIQNVNENKINPNRKKDPLDELLDNYSTTNKNSKNTH